MFLSSFLISFRGFETTTASSHHPPPLLSAGFGADVDSFVLHTNYEEYAMLFQLSSEKLIENKTATVRLYSQ